MTYYDMYWHIHTPNKFSANVSLLGGVVLLSKIKVVCEWEDELGDVLFNKSNIDINTVYCKHSLEKKVVSYNFVEIVIIFVIVYYYYNYYDCNYYYYYDLLLTMFLLLIYLIIRQQNNYILLIHLNIVHNVYLCQVLVFQ